MKQLLLVALLTMLTASLVKAQDNSCPPIVADTLASTTENCSDVNSGEACYGHATIQAIANCEDAPAFSSPGDILPINILCSMQLSAMQSPDTWGMAVMKVPIEARESNATYVLFGDVHIQNAGGAFTQVEAHVLSDADIHSGPGSHYDTIGAVKAGETIIANACNCTGNWVRIRLESGAIGWVANRNLEILGDFNTLPSVNSDTPVYQAMQAFNFSSASHESNCEEAPQDGILIQVPSDVDEMAIQINGVNIVLGATIFVQSVPDGVMTIEVLSGMAHITVDTFAAAVPAGARVSIPISDSNTTSDTPTIEVYTEADVMAVPIQLLPEPIDPTAALHQNMPMIVGLESCAVQADRGASICPLYFMNPDGDTIVSMDVEFVSAPQGEWESSVRQNPELLSGDYASGTLSWDNTCSLQGGIVFIGPVVWSITITDEEGHISEPFEAQLNCVP